MDEKELLQAMKEAGINKTQAQEIGENLYFEHYKCTM